MRTDKSYMIVISHFKLYPALFPLKWLICIPNISAVRGNVVFETLHDFYRTAIEKNPKLGQDSNSRVLRQSFSRPFQFAKFVRRDSVIFPENSMEMLYRFKSHLEGNLFTCQIFREKDFFAACQFQLQKIMSW